MAAEMHEKYTPASPATRAAVAGPPPLYGTCSGLIPVWRLNRSPVRCVMEPGPEEANAISLECAFAYSISCGIVLTPSLGLTTRTSGDCDGSAIGSMSFNGLYGSLV